MQLRFCLMSASFTSGLLVYSIDCNHPLNYKKLSQRCFNTQLLFILNYPFSISSSYLAANQEQNQIVGTQNKKHPPTPRALILSREVEQGWKKGQMEVKRTQTIQLCVFRFCFSCRLLCTAAILGGRQRDTKGWVGCGAVEKLKHMAGWFWKESIQRNTVKLLAALLVSGHC